MLSITEKWILIWFLSVVIFYLLGWQNSELTCTRIFLDFKSHFFCNWTITSKSICASGTGTHRAYSIAVSAFWCRSLLLSLVVQPRDMQLESPIQNYALYHNAQMELHSLHVTLYNKWCFIFLSKDDFRVDNRVLSFLVVKTTWISHNFFSLLAKFWVMFHLYWEKPRFKPFFVKILTLKKSW